MISKYNAFIFIIILLRFMSDNTAIEEFINTTNFIISLIIIVFKL